MGVLCVLIDTNPTLCTFVDFSMLLELHNEDLGIVGFTAATGMQFQSHFVEYWELNTS